MGFALLSTRTLAGDCDYDVTLTLARLTAGPDEQLVLGHTTGRKFMCVSTLGAFGTSIESWSLGGNHSSGIIFNIYSIIPFTATVNQWLLECNKYDTILEGEVWLRAQSVSVHTFGFVEVVLRDQLP